MTDDAIKFCKKILPRVSRSFALTIPMLDRELYLPVMVTYLQDRLLDNFEDEIRDISLEQRKYLMDRVVKVFDPERERPDSAINDIREHAHLIPDQNLRVLTENIGLVREAYQQLEERIKKISFYWLKEMNLGMQKYLEEDVSSFNQLDEYCYYVAGTVGGFLTETILSLFDRIGTAERDILLANYNHAGLFLQKVNLVRDIKRDIIHREKNFWPLEELQITEEQLLKQDNKTQAMQALNLMTEDIKQHIEGLTAYFEALPEKLSGYKRFYCVNNALGLATLRKLEIILRFSMGREMLRLIS